MAFKKLLILEDDKILAHLYKLRFEYDGWQVEVSYSAESALELLKSERFHPQVILLDLILPKMHGDEFLSIIRSDPSMEDIAVIIITALSPESGMARKVKECADDFVAKIDITPQELVKRVDNLVAKKAQKVQVCT